MKKIAKWILLGLCVLANAFALASCKDSNSYYFAKIENKEEYRLEKFKNISSSDLIIPSTYKGLPVTGVGQSSFYDCDKLTSVVIPDGVTYIGHGAFYGCDNLTSITLPSSVVSFHRDAFQDCNNLKNVYYTGSIADWCNIKFRDTETSNPLFNGATLYINNETVTTLTIPDTVKAIKDYSFTNCNGLTSVSIPDSVTSIGKSAFANCDITSVTFGNNLTSIGSRAFENCKITNITLPNSTISTDTFTGCPITKATLHTSDIFSIPKDYLKTLVITSGEFEENSLYLPNVTNVILGDDITSIKENTFHNCPNLNSITLGTGLTSIEEDAFYECNKLVEIINHSNLPIKKRSYDYGGIALHAISIHNEQSKIVNKNDFMFVKDENNVNYLFNYTGKDTDLRLPENFNGESYQIGRNVFSKNTTLKSVIIPDSVTAINGSAFSDCTNLTDVIIGDGVISIEEFAFAYCTNLTNVTLGENVNSIGNYVFFKSNLQDITIPESVTSIGEDTFANCKNLTTIVIGDNITSLHASAFANSAYYNDENNWENGLLYIGKNLIASKGDISNECVIKDGTLYIAHCAFVSYKNLTSVVIPESVISIGKNVFWLCNNLTNVYYNGTQSNWNEIEIGYNYNLNSTTLYYYSEYPPTEEGNFWHYDTDGVTPVVW